MSYGHISLIYRFTFCQSLKCPIIKPFMDRFGPYSNLTEVFTPKKAPIMFHWNQIKTFWFIERTSQNMCNFMKNVKKILKNSVFTSRKNPEFMLYYLVRSQFVPILKALGPEMTLERLKITRSQKHRKWAVIRPICGQIFPLSNLT